jgi:hypothetical protein
VRFFSARLNKKARNIPGLCLFNNADYLQVPALHLQSAHLQSLPHLQHLSPQHELVPHLQLSQAHFSQLQQLVFTPQLALIALEL